MLGPREKLLPGDELERLARRSEVEVVTMPPSGLEVMRGEMEKVRTLVVAGEACTEELARRWSEGRRMLNAYGPTETTVCATISEELSGGGGRR